MIAHLQGTLLEKSQTHLVIDVAGVGYETLVSLATYQRVPNPGELVTLHIYTHVREDEIVLFGFAEPNEKALFQKLIKVNGVGPRLAINILSKISSNELIQAIAQEDIVRLTNIPGIGKKTAERIILDLKEKILELYGQLAPEAVGKSGGFQEDLLSVLVNLGYKRNVAERALRTVPLSDDLSLEEGVRLTLKHLGR